MVSASKAIRFKTLLALTAIFVALETTSRADEGDLQTQHEKILFTESVEAGFLFVDGESINAPYTVQATATSVIINGVGVEPLQSKFSDSQESHPGFGRRRWRPQQPVSIIRARAFANQINTNCVVVCFSEHPSVPISPVDEELLFQTLVDSERPTARINELAALAPNESAKELWRQWLADFQPSASLREKLDSRLAMIEEWRANTKALNSADRGELFSYPLVLVGMLLSVVAFGHLMHWTKLGFHGPGEKTSEVTWYVVIALLLMFGMATLDLVWTTVCTQAGAMTELNPVATLFTHSPAQLAMFKFAATGVSFAIFYFFRSRRQVQQAAWWMCLVCVLLTFRWVVIDSMMP